MMSGLGGHGIAAIYEFGNSGPTVMIRCELDALPIQEQNAFDYCSQHMGVSHKCGHDGHMAMVAGLAPWIQEQDLIMDESSSYFNQQKKPVREQLKYL